MCILMLTIGAVLVLLCLAAVCLLVVEMSGSFSRCAGVQLNCILSILNVSMAT